MCTSVADGPASQKLHVTLGIKESLLLWVTVAPEQISPDFVFLSDLKMRKGWGEF